jgi:cobalt/nickel transport system permease protein
VLGVSLGLFLVAAVLEGVITLAVLTALERINPGWIRQPEGKGRLGVGLLLAGAVFLAAVGALFASALPDGLEKFAEEIGIAGRARNLIETPLAGYVWKGLPSEPLGQSAAGLLGVAAVFALLWLAACWMRRRGA